MKKNRQLSFPTAEFAQVIKIDHSQLVTINPTGSYLMIMDQPDVQLTVKLANQELAAPLVAADLKLVIWHRAPRTESTTVLSRVIGAHQSWTVTAMVAIDRPAVAAIGQLSVRALLLATSARAKLVPQLEILPHQVQCHHEAVVSWLPKEPLNYLVSRGLSHQTAQQLLIQAFLAS